jgi:hypothetical protein
MFPQETKETRIGNIFNLSPTNQNVSCFLALREKKPETSKTAPGRHILK